jgi:glycerophosphoryl diester phosphodiesterase
VTRWRAGAAALVVGHRGGRGPGWPSENTLPAFERARKEGATAIELDVRTCAGGDVVVFHDATLERMTGGRDVRRVADVPLRELETTTLTGGGAVPTLAAVLAWAASHDVSVNVEMKHDVPRRRDLARRTVAVIEASGADVVLSSFDPVLLLLAAAMAPSIPRAFLTHVRQHRVAAAVAELARPAVLRSLHLERVQGAAAAVARYRGRGLLVGAWTVNDPAEGQRLAADGVNFIITDAPGVMREALAAVPSAPSGRAVIRT